MKSAEVLKKLGISEYKLKKLRERGEIIATLSSDGKHYEYDGQSVTNFYKRLYYKAKLEKIRETDPYYKKGVRGRKKFIENIGIIGKNAISLVTKDIGDLKVPSKQNTPNFLKKQGPKGIFTEKKFLQVHESYDFLRNLGIVSNYIKARYGYDMNTMQTLLFLYPIQYFTLEDYKEFPHKGKYKKPLKLDGKPNELIEITVRSTNKLNHIYSLTPKSKRIVVYFYKLLAGVKQIPKDANKKLKTKVNFKKVDPISDLAFYLAGKEVDA